jgi:hypothetical protein
MRNRRVAAFLVLVVLLAPATEASAAGTKLSAKPPGPMGSATTQRGSSRLPYTGLNLWADLLVAAVLLSAGAAIRIRETRTRAPRGQIRLWPCPGSVGVAQPGDR